MSPITSAQQIREAFLDLLDQQLDEQRYQSFIEQNTRLIPREFIQNHGIHFDLALRKLRISQDYITDFFYLSKSSADWNCVLIELEKPHSKYFKDHTNDFHSDFLAAMQQISRWRAWFSEPTNHSSFTEETIGAIRGPLHENPSYIKYVLVFGRRSEFKNNAQRRRLIQSQERDDFKILSFDSLVEALESKNDLYLGVRKNEHYEIHSHIYVGEMLFSWLLPEQIRINSELRRDIENHRSEWITTTTDNMHHLLLDDLLPKISDF